MQTLPKKSKNLKKSEVYQFGLIYKFKNSTQWFGLVFEKPKKSEFYQFGLVYKFKIFTQMVWFDI